MESFRVQLAHIPIGAKFTFNLKDGRSCSGMVLSAQRHHVRLLEIDGGARVIAANRISDWAPYRPPLTFLPVTSGKGCRD